MTFHYSLISLEVSYIHAYSTVLSTLNYLRTDSAWLISSVLQDSFTFLKAYDSFCCLYVPCLHIYMIKTPVISLIMLLDLVALIYIYFFFQSLIVIDKTI